MSSIITVRKENPNTILHSNLKKSIKNCFDKNSKENNFENKIEKNISLESISYTISLKNKKIDSKKPHTNFSKTKIDQKNTKSIPTETNPLKTFFLHFIKPAI